MTVHIESFWYPFLLEPANRGSNTHARSISPGPGCDSLARTGFAKLESVQENNKGLFKNVGKKLSLQWLIIILPGRCNFSSYSPRHAHVGVAVCPEQLRALFAHGCMRHGTFRARLPAVFDWIYTLFGSTHWDSYAGQPSAEDTWKTHCGHQQQHGSPALCELVPFSWQQIMRKWQCFMLLHPSSPTDFMIWIASATWLQRPGTVPTCRTWS